MAAMPTSTMSPPPCKRPNLAADDDGEDDDFDFDTYFSCTYRPLSNLPTPPPSSRDDDSFIESPSCLDDGECLESDLLGPAIHLVNLLPPSASLATPSVPLVQAILSRARLPLDVVALAVCILDSLGSKFALSWRLTCPLRRDGDGDGAAPGAAPALLPTASKRHTLPAAAPPTPPGEPAGTAAEQQQLHIDSVHPEVVVLAALTVASKFAEDFHEPARYYAAEWGRGVWTCAQLNATELCIMRSLGWRLLPLWDRELIDDALADMRKAGRAAAQHQHQQQQTRAAGAAAVGLGLGLQLTTPAGTPAEERPAFAAPSLFRGAAPPPPPRAADHHRRHKTVSSRLEGLIDGMTHP